MITSPLMEVITTILIILNITIMIGTSFLSLQTYKNKRIWIDLLISGIAIVWASFYTYKLISDAQATEIVSQLFIRPLNTMTFLIMLILVQLRSIGKTYGKR
jgi:heme O synthase-like polyprenyltransferase